MAAGTMATAAGAAVLLYYMLSRRIKGRGQVVAAAGDEDDDDRARSGVVGGKRKMTRRPAQAPATWLETLTTLSETLRFTYSETLGKWPIGDLAFGINYLLRRQGNLDLASIYGGSGSVKLRGPAIVAELKELVRLLPLCYFFSKKPFHVFLELAGYSKEDVLIQSPKAGILKPAFTTLHDRDSKCFLLLIRGTHSMKDTLTAATGAVVPFHHSVLDDGGISNLVLGYAHCGMVAAARWIAKLITPCLVKALAEYPDHRIKVVGHSLGGGTASLLTYILREQKEFSSSTCVTFGSAACMTWELAESGKHFITSVINGSDLVPTFSSASADDLRSEVTASSWLNDLRDQVEHTRVLNVVYWSATALGSRLPSVASAKARVAGAGALLRPVSSSTQVVIKRAQYVAQAVAKTRPSLSSWSCIGPRRRAVIQALNSKVEDLPDDASMGGSSGTAIVESQMQDTDSVPIETDDRLSVGSHPDDTEEEEEEPLISDDRVIDSSTIEQVTGGDLWYELEKELRRDKDKVDIRAEEEEAAAAKEITEEERVLVISAENTGVMSTRDISESMRFYPPGRILHIVPVSPPCTDADSGHNGVPGEEAYALYETPRELYTKLRLSRTMIHDHFMPVYKKRIELLISQLGQQDQDDDDCSVVC